MTDDLETGWAQWCPVFLFFSNRLGCLGSVLLSLAVTAVLLLLLSLF